MKRTLSVVTLLLISVVNPVYGLSGLGITWTRAPTSPNESVLIKVEEKSNSHETVVCHVNAFSVQSDTLDEYTRPFNCKKTAPSVYKATTPLDLTDNEYGFFCGGTSPLATFDCSSAGGPEVLDFGLRGAL